MEKCLKSISLGEKFCINAFSRAIEKDLQSNSLFMRSKHCMKK